MFRLFLKCFCTLAQVLEQASSGKTDSIPSWTLPSVAYIVAKPLDSVTRLNLSLASASAHAAH